MQAPLLALAWRTLRTGCCVLGFPRLINLWHAWCLPTGTWNVQQFCTKLSQAKILRLAHDMRLEIPIGPRCLVKRPEKNEKQSASPRVHKAARVQSVFQDT